MAITTMDQLVSAMGASGGLNNRPIVFKNALAGTFPSAGAANAGISLWTATGAPGAGAAQGTAAGAVPTSATTGAVIFTDPSSGNSYASRLLMSSTVPGTLVLYDRIWHDSALVGNLNTAQTVSSVALTRPDANGTSAELFMEVYTAIGATPTTVTASYTNSAGTSGHTTVAATVAASLPAGAVVFMPLAAGDTGIKAIASMTLAASTGTAGNVGLTIARRLCSLPIPTANQAYLFDPFQMGLPQIYNSACLWMVYYPNTGTAAPALQCGELVVAQG